MNKLILLSVLLFSCNQDYISQSDEELSYEFVLLDSLNKKFKQGDFEGSLKGMKQYVKDYPEADYGFNLLATIYLAKGEDSLALISVKRAISLNPNNYGALTNYGIILDRYGQHEEAAKYYKKTIEIKPDFPQVYSNFMGNRLSVGDYQQARIYGEKSIRLINNIGDKGILCAVYHKLKMYEKRDSLYEELKRLNYKNLNKLEEIISEKTY